MFHFVKKKDQQRTFQVLQKPNSKNLTFLQQNTGDLTRTKASKTSFPVQSDLCSIRNTPVKKFILILIIFYTKQEKMTC